VPGDFQVAGWFTGGPQPGQLGPAVIAGHVDSRTGPAVFYRLRDLRPGDQIRVVRADRLVVRFRVESLASFPKQALPDDAVFGATTTPALRLITCAGTFDRARHSYRDNLVVSAVRVADGGRAEANR
jgi:sortase (surface protein transpeptidase)